MYNSEELSSVDKMKEECGVFGIFSTRERQDLSLLTYFGLYALQHRGQESAGIALCDGYDVKVHKGMGLVSEVFKAEDLKQLTGNISIGHVRYSTTGSSLITNAQPLVARYLGGPIALAHNGNLVNTDHLRKELEQKGTAFLTSIDSEVIINLIAQQVDKPTVEDGVIACISKLEGAYSLVIMTQDKLIGVRDPHGIRPLCLGQMADGSYVLSSETCALDVVGAKLIRDVGPGEVVVINKEGYKVIPTTSPRRASCVFEYIYFARPDSTIDGINVHLARQRMGQTLAGEYPIEADIVVPVPDSGISAAMGFSQATGIPYENGLMKNRYVGRTFIQPKQELREFAVKLKLNPIREIVEGKKVVLIDDSIVRGTTSGKIVQLLREAGAKEVHMYITSPPISHPCFYGIDTSIRKELIASSHTVEEIRSVIKADSLCYLSIEGLMKSVGLEKKELCLACFNGCYAVKASENIGVDKYILEARRDKSE